MRCGVAERGEIGPDGVEPGVVATPTPLPGEISPPVGSTSPEVSRGGSSPSPKHHPMLAVTSSELNVEVLSSLISLTTPSALGAYVRPSTVFTALRRATTTSPTHMAWLQSIVTHSLNYEWSWYVPHAEKTGVATHIVALCPSLADTYASLGGNMGMPIDFFQRGEVLTDIYPDAPIPAELPSWDSHPVEVLLLSDEVNPHWPLREVVKICAGNLALDKVPICSDGINAISERLTAVRDTLTPDAWSFIVEAVRRDLAVDIINRIAIEVRKHGTTDNPVASVLTSSLVGILECCGLATPYLDLLRRHSYRGLIVGHSTTSIQRLAGLPVLGLPLPTKRRVELISTILDDPRSHRTTIVKGNSSRLRQLLDPREPHHSRKKTSTKKTTGKTRRSRRTTREAEVDYVAWDLIVNTGRGGKVRLLPRNSGEISLKSRVEATHRNSMATLWNLGAPMPVLEMLEDMLMRLDEIVL